jgi:hypothetical protein
VTAHHRRNDAESINRHFDDTLRLRRAHSIGNLRQLLNMITYALGVNGLEHARAPPEPRPATGRLSPRVCANTAFERSGIGESL